jgi:hypothetical protein
MSSVAARWCLCASSRKPIGLMGSNISHGTSSNSSAGYGFSVLTHSRSPLTHLSAIRRRRRGRTIEKKSGRSENTGRRPSGGLLCRSASESCGFDCSRSIHCHHIDARSTEPILLRLTGGALRQTVLPRRPVDGSQIDAATSCLTAACPSIPWTRRCDEATSQTVSAVATMQRWQRIPHHGDARHPPHGHSSISLIRWRH